MSSGASVLCKPLIVLRSTQSALVLPEQLQHQLPRASWLKHGRLSRQLSPEMHHSQIIHTQQLNLFMFQTMVLRPVLPALWKLQLPTSMQACPREWYCRKQALLPSIWTQVMKQMMRRYLLAFHPLIRLSSSLVLNTYL